MKNINIILGIIIVLIIILIGLGSGYLIYNNSLNDNTTQKDNSVLSNTNKYTMELLEKKLITTDNVLGLYNTKNINENNKNFIIFNIRQYLLDNNMENYHESITDYTYSLEITREDGFVIKKNIINNYIHQKYNTTNNYDIANQESIDFGSDTEEIVGLNEEYVIIKTPKSGTTTYFENKSIKLEEDKQYFYLHDKAVKCIIQDEIYECGNITIEEEFESLYKCSYFENGTKIIDDNCLDFNGQPSIKKAAEYVLENYFEKLTTFKHTFKKSDNEESFWISSEIIK